MTSEAQAIFTPLVADDGVEPDREWFMPTEHSSSPWGAHLVHGGPVTGLLVRSMNRLPGIAGGRLSRVTIEILGPILVAPLGVRAWTDRPGKRIELLGAEMTQVSPDGEERVVARASGWRMRTEDTADARRHADSQMLPRESADAALDIGLPPSWISGFVAAMEWVVLTPIGGAEPTQAWLRLPVPLVEGEELSDLERVYTIADTANGIGARLDPAEWIFLNTEITTHVYDQPVGEWVGFIAETSVGGDGIGLGAASIYSETGPIGRVAQNILIERRSGGPSE